MKSSGRGAQHSSANFYLYNWPVYSVHRFGITIQNSEHLEFASPTLSSYLEDSYERACAL